MPQKREEIIATLFDNMSATKRSMYSHMQAITRDSPISHTQLELLFSIKHLQPISFKQLATQLHVTAGAISQLADVLEQHSFIEREIDPNDRRVQSLRLSKQGEKQIQKIEERRRDILGHVMQSLSDEELAVWLRIQQKMAAQFKVDIQQDAINKGAN